MNNIIEYLFSSCKKEPTRLFCVDDKIQYTYENALEKIESIACFFYDKNIQNMPIMFKAERNCDSLLTLLGILLSNNYFVPINPQYSDDKISSIISSSNIQYAVCFGENMKNGLTNFSFSEITSYKAKSETIDTLSKNFNQDNFIYTIYTSGSTGVPKGVIKTHKNVIAFVQNFLQTFKIQNNLKIANQSPLFFDASMKDVFLTLATGGTIYFPDKSLFSVPLKLVEYLNNNEINFIIWVPSALTIVARLNTFKYILPKYLEYVMFVGETFLPKYLNMWLKNLPNITYVNLYGSTELAGVCLYKIVSKELKEDKPIPLGKPLANNTVELLDGEIVIKSDQIATGYVNDEKKNCEVFLSLDGQKMLKTGDFGYINESGDFVFMSRKDYQIKHLGYRIELQEIDVSISKLKYISNCAVVFDKQNDKIVAFVSLCESLQNPTKTIISDLKTYMPTYMIPNKVIVLDELPLNANGKIDRTKLNLMIGE